MESKKKKSQRRQSADRLHPPPPVYDSQLLWTWAPHLKGTKTFSKKRKSFLFFKNSYISFTKECLDIFEGRGRPRIPTAMEASSLQVCFGALCPAAVARHFRVIFQADHHVQDRLRDYSKSFDGLLSLIDAKTYYGEDTAVCESPTLTLCTPCQPSHQPKFATCS